MSGIEFYQTIQGKRFFEGTLPNLVKNLEALNESVKTLNANIEKQNELLDRQNNLLWDNLPKEVKGQEVLGRIMNSDMDNSALNDKNTVKEIKDKLLAPKNNLLKQKLEEEADREDYEEERDR